MQLASLILAVFFEALALIALARGREPAFYALTTCAQVWGAATVLQG